MAKIPGRSELDHWRGGYPCLGKRGSVRSVEWFRRKIESLVQPAKPSLEKAAGEDSGRSRGRPPRWLLGVLAAGVSLAVVPRWICGWQAKGYFESQTSTVAPLARHVAQAVTAHRGLEFFASGRTRFDGQSAVAIYQMTLLGLGQVVLEHPELRDEFLPAMRIAAERLANPRTLRYASLVYPAHGVVDMRPGDGHAYLGYINLGLGMLRRFDPHMAQAAVHDRLTHELAQRLDQSSTGMIETYPGETWPPDVAAVAGSIGLHGRATGQDWGPLLRRWSERFSRCGVDSSGYLVQRLASGSCRPTDAPRGSGTAVAAYFVSFADRTLSARLHQALRDHGRRTLLGFGGILEDPIRHTNARDGNSGPVLFGVSMGATGFGLGSARAHGDRELFVELFRTTSLFGVPDSHGTTAQFTVGGPLGNSLLLAMLTARPD